jgi:hypothetical protein
MKNGVVNWFVLVIVKVKALIVTCEEAACGRGRTISRMLKDCAAKVYTTFFYATENLELHIRKRTSKIYFTVNKYIHTNPAYILFFDIHLVLFGNNTEF